jgi:PAS domain S-box-containing protein
MMKSEDIDYKHLFGSLPERYLLIEANDDHYNIVDCSDVYLATTDRSRKDIIGQPIFTSFPDVTEKNQNTGVSDLRQSFRKVIRTGKLDSMDDFRYDITDSKGSFAQRYWRVVHYPIFDKSKKIIFILQTSQDVSDEKQVENELTHVRQELQDALSIGKVGSWTWDVQSDKVMADRKMAEMYGIRTEKSEVSLPLQSFTNGIHPLDRDRVTAVIAQVIKEAGSFEEEYRTINSEGDRRWILARGKVEVDDKGQAVRFPGVIVDITDRKQVELNLNFLAKASATLASSLDYRKTLRTIADLAVPTIADWCSVEMLDSNKNLQQVGLAHKDPAKIQWAKEMREHQGTVNIKDDTPSAQVVRTGQTVFYPEITDEMIQAASHSPEELALTRKLNLSSIIIVPITLNNKPIGIISLISAELKRHYTPLDVDMATELATRASLAIANARLYAAAKAELTERRKLELQLQQSNMNLENRVTFRTKQLQTSNTNLERSNQELQDFAYVASHDLQEPLRKIQAFGDLLQDEYGAKLGEGADYIDRMSNAASRMSTLIEDLLSFSRVSTQTRPFVQVDLAKIAQEVLSDLEIRVNETGAKVTVGKLPTITADPLQMRQLLQNLIGNALKFNREGVRPTVAIKAKKIGAKDGTRSAIVLTVADNGIGFDEKYLDRIFAVFQRLHNRNSYKGTGIGLAICRKIVERHGGTITATSQPDHGATFVVTLPESVHNKKTKQ